jgi:hypothetical protein
VKFNKFQLNLIALTLALAGFSAGEYVISGSAVGALIITWFDVI